MTRPGKLLRFFPLALVATTAVACESSESPASPQDVSVAGVVEANASLSTLQAVLTQAGLLSVLDSGGPYTLFAPTDGAFGAVPGDLLAEVLGDAELLETVLLNHAGRCGSETLW